MARAEPRGLTPLQRWVRAADAFRRADEYALATAKDALPAGQIVSWTHGEYERTAEVVGVYGIAWRTARVRVRSMHGKEYDVGASTLLFGLRPDGHGLARAARRAAPASARPRKGPRR